MQVGHRLRLGRLDHERGLGQHPLEALVQGVGDVADAAVAGAAVADVAHPYGWGVPPVEGWPPLPPGYLAWPSFPGEAPCYTPAGQPYYTPGTMPCYPA